MSKIIAAGIIGPGYPTLEEQLEISVAINEGRAILVRKEQLPTELELHTVHAQLARACRIANGEEVPPCPF